MAPPTDGFNVVTWIINLIIWYIGYICFGICMYFGNILGFFTLWPIGTSIVNTIGGIFLPIINPDYPLDFLTTPQVNPMSPSA